jgi:CDP-6-deoxy-D-xylo-4-hexulose-3-dehydrase
MSNELTKIHLAGDTIDKGDVDSLIEWLKTYPRLTKGPLTVDYEEKWSSYLESRYSLFVNSGSSANLLVLASMVEVGMIQPGDPKVLLLVSVLGLVPDMEQICDICDQNSIFLIEDTCESLSSEFRNKKLGTFGLASTFSTYFGHHISTIEGGMVCTDDVEFMNVLKSTRSHGWDRDMDPDCQKTLRSENKVDDFSARFTFYFSGFNFRGTDLQAFLGLKQLEKLPSIVEKRNKTFMRYYKELNLSWKPVLYDDRKISNFAYPIIHPRRSEIVDALQEKNIEVRPLICGSLGTQPFYIKYNGAPTILENASLISSSGFYIPNHAELSDDDVTRIIHTVNNFY